MSNGFTDDLDLLNAYYIRVPSLNNSRAFITNFSKFQIDHEQQSKATNHTIKTRITGYRVKLCYMQITSTSLNNPIVPDTMELNLESHSTLPNWPKIVNYGNLTYINTAQPQPKSTISDVKFVAVALVNCCSLNKDGLKLKDHIIEHDCDVIAVTETWLSREEILTNHIIRDTCPKGYKMSHPRNTGQRGGGVGIIHKNSLDIRVVSHDSSFSSFQHTEHLLKLCTWIRLIVIYIGPHHHQPID